MHAVDEINVGASSGAEHNFRALGETARSVRSEVIKAEVRFRLDDHSRCFAVRQNAAEQRWCEFDCRTFEELQSESFSLFEEHAQNGRGFKRAIRRHNLWLCRLTARIRALCALNETSFRGYKLEH